MNREDHHYRCDYALTPVPADAECYCPMPGEELLSCGHQQEQGCECADFEVVES